MVMSGDCGWDRNKLLLDKTILKVVSMSKHIPNTLFAIYSVII